MSGIDYGGGTCNIDKETGIRYGVISIHEVTQAWSDSAIGDYGDPTCPKCGNKALDVDDQPETNYRNDEDYDGEGDYVCDACKFLFYADDAFGEQPIAWILDDGEYKATQGGDDYDIFVLKSPYYTRCEFCSPCAPGAGYLVNEGGVRAYCFGHDFYWDRPDYPHRAPYRIFRVADDREIFAIPELVDCAICKGTGKDSLQRIADVRGVKTELLLDDKVLMQQIDGLHFDPFTDTFDCWQCKGTSKTETTVEHIGDESSNCRRCDKPIIREADVWIDQTGGDVCGWDGGNESHEPTGET